MGRYEVNPRAKLTTAQAARYLGVQGYQRGVGAQIDAGVDTFLLPRHVGQAVLDGRAPRKAGLPFLLEQGGIGTDILRLIQQSAGAAE